MGKSLIVTEKPSVARDIAAALRVNSENKGGYFEDERYVISWAAGHLFSLGYPGDQKQEWEEYKLETLPMFAPLKVFPLTDTMKQLNVLVKLIGRADIDEIINAGDAGIEGEGIQWEIYNYAFARTGKRKKVRRLWISSVSEKAIIEGFNNLEPDGSRANLYQAFLARRDGDWFYGMNTSRFFGLTYKVKGLSSGSVKNQILGMVVKRCRDIQNFKPEPYYQVAANINNSFSVGWCDEDGNTFKNKGDAEAVVTKVSGQSGIVTLYETKEKTQKPPALYSLVKIQSEAVKQYGITSDRTLEILQSLYQDYKITTYPRTDSEYITSNNIYEIQPLVEAIATSSFIQEMDVSISQMAQKILAEGLEINQIVDDKKVNDHPGLLINDNFANFHGELKPDEKIILGMIIKRMIISLSRPYKYTETIIQLECNGETFGCKGTTPISMGYKEVSKGLKQQEQKTEESDPVLPQLSPGETVQFVAAEVLDKVTKAPQYFNESTLFNAMENIASLIEDKQYKKVLKDKKGIGTSATRAAIFKELLDKRYLFKDDSRNKKLPYIKPTELGEKIFDVLPEDMTTPELAAKWQEMLNQIETGSITYEYYMKEMQAFITDKVKNYQKIEGIDIASEQEKPTDKQMNLAKSISLTLDIPMPSELTITALSEFISENMERYVLAPEKKYAQETSFAIGKCPLCGGDVNVAKSGANYYCVNYKQGCKFSVMKSDYSFKKITGKDITKAVMKSLLSKGSVKCGGKFVKVQWNTGVSPKGFMTHTYS